MKALGPAPLALPSGPAHRAPGLDRSFDMIGGFHHQVEHGVSGANHTHPFKLRPRIDPCDEGLVVRFLFVTQLDVKEPELVALGSCVAAFEQVTCFRRCAWHERDPECIDNRYAHKGLPFSWSRPR